jgi:hypothetical protein
MFLLNRGYRRTINEEIDRINGSVLLPSGNVSEKLLRMPPEYNRVLVDPQLYLASLLPNECEKVCARLATFPWFGVRGLPEFDSSDIGLREWEVGVRDRIRAVWPGRAPRGNAIGNAAASAIEFQLQMRVSFVILPSPLITEREDEAQTQAEWLDAGVDAATRLEVGQPVVATIAVHEAVLNDAAFEPAGFLDTIVDQVTARENVDGVYIVIAQEGGASHPFETATSVLRAYLHLVRACSERPYETIITNFADIFGLACMGMGATIVASGPSHSLRRLSMAGFHEQGGGRPLPQYYSHPCIGEFLPETHLSNVIARNRGALRRVRDETDFSTSLLDALDRGDSASSVPAWAEGQNNVAEAQRHFIARFAAEAHAISRRRDRTERAQHARDWLEDALATRLFLANRFGDAGRVGRYAPADVWLDLLERV